MLIAGACSREHYPRVYAYVYLSLAELRQADELRETHEPTHTHTHTHTHTPTSAPGLELLCLHSSFGKKGGPSPLPTFTPSSL
jgi:hypothetical protein